jgi:hypothetical protein
MVPRRLVSAIAIASAYAMVAGAAGAGAAVVSGKAPDGTSFRLDRARLVVHLRAPVRDAAVRCGDVAGLTPRRAGHAGLIFGDVVRRKARSRHAARTVRVRFARNISARVSVCFITRPGDDPASPSSRRQAHMRLRSGTPAGCRPGHNEVTLLSIGDVQILLASGGGVALRACRSGDARPTPLVSDFAGLNVRAGPFRVSGDAVAAQIYHETPSGDPVSKVAAVDLATKRRIGTIKPRIRASEVAVSSAGVLACIERPSWDDNAGATVLARRRDGKIVTLDSSPGNVLSGLKVDGTTVSWLHGGAARSASVAR